MLFILVFIVFNLFGVFLHNIFKRLFIGWFDRSLAVGLALIKGIIISYLLIVLLTFFMPSKTPLIAKSKAARLVTGTYQSMIRLISPDLYEIWKERISQESKTIGKEGNHRGERGSQKLPTGPPGKKTIAAMSLLPIPWWILEATSDDADRYSEGFDSSFWQRQRSTPVVVSWGQSRPPARSLRNREALTDHSTVEQGHSSYRSLAQGGCPHLFPLPTSLQRQQQQQFRHA